MILQQLERDFEHILRYGSDEEDEENADTGMDSPSMYDLKPVQWKIALDAAGRFEGFVRLSGGGKKDRGRPMLVPSLVRTVNISPLLFADTPAYVLGAEMEDKNADRKHTAFRALVDRCAEHLNTPAPRAVSAFLAWWDSLDERPPLPEEMTKSDLITFDVEDTWPVDEQKTRAFWAEYCDATRSATVPKQCLVCSEIRPPVENMPFMLKGLPNGQTSGTALVSANSDVFESYGLKRATTSPICASCAERFSKSLKSLMAGDSTRKRIGPIVYVFWTADGPSREVNSLSRPEPDWVKSLIESYRTGKRYSLQDETAFYAIALSASAARAVVRDWITTTIGHVRDNIARWFLWLEVPDAFGQPGRPLADWQLAASLYRKSEDVEARVSQVLMRAALYSDPLPMDLLNRAVLRNRADRDITYERAALMTAILRSHQKDGQSASGIPTDSEETMEENSTISEDSVKDRQARLCGRLLAVLEEIQRAQADTKISATLVDRFYGAASSAPGTVFGTLLSSAQPHLTKLRKKNGFLHNLMQEQMEKIQGELYGLGDFPMTLTLRRQALFSLGYYHERAAMRAEARAAVEAKRMRALQAEDAATTNSVDKGQISVETSEE